MNELELPAGLIFNPIMTGKYYAFPLKKNWLRKYFHPVTVISYIESNQDSINGNNNILNRGM